MKSQSRNSTKKLQGVWYTLANLGGVPGSRPLPPQGTRLFHFDIQNFRNITASGVNAPPYEVDAPCGKSWIRHWYMLGVGTGSIYEPGYPKCIQISTYFVGGGVLNNYKYSSTCKSLTVWYGTVADPGFPMGD